VGRSAGRGLTSAFQITNAFLFKSRHKLGCHHPRKRGLCRSEQGSRFESDLFMFGFVFVYKKPDFCKALAQADDPVTTGRPLWHCRAITHVASVYWMRGHDDREQWDGDDAWGTA
jgi:hypothetical protein